jgi:hypothetical protein
VADADAGRLPAAPGAAGGAWDLARLLGPLDEATFFERHYERSAWWHRFDAPGRFDSLLTIDAIDMLVSALEWRHPDLQMVNGKAEHPLEPEDYTWEGGVADVARVWRHYADGATLVLSQLHAVHAPLAALCRQLERSFGCRVQTNIYLTPTASQGFKTHYDTHDVIVLQVAGRKRWRLYDTPVDLPLRGQRFFPGTYAAVEPSADFELGPGDVAYVPRGLMHDASTIGEHSLHITVGIIGRTWAELLVEAVSQAALHDPDLRRTLPRGYAGHGADVDAMRPTFEALLARVAASPAHLEAARATFADDFIQGRSPVLAGQMRQVALAEAITPATRVRARPGLVFDLVDDAKQPGQLALMCAGVRLSLPPHARGALLAMLRAGAPVSIEAVREAPGAAALDLDGCAVLARRLVRAGLLEIVEG